jgi:rhamnosyltransferase
MRNQFTLDLIIPIYKPDEKLNQLIDRIMEQTVLPNNIFLLHTVDTNCNKEVNETLKSLEYINGLSNPMCKITVKDIDKKDFDHGGTRNLGAKLSKADIIMFMTQDAVPSDKKLIESLMEPLYNEDIASAYARQLPSVGSSVLERYSRTFNYPPISSVKSKKDLDKLGIKTYFCSNVCAAYKRNIYESLGGFTTKTIFNEDMIMAYYVIKNNYKIAYAAEAKVFHSHEYTNIAQFKRNFDLAVSQEQFSFIFSNVKSETEGIKFVKNTISYLINHKKAYLIPEFIIQSGFKYLGYKLGRNYKKLPIHIIKKLSMNPTYWDK